MAKNISCTGWLQKTDSINYLLDDCISLEYLKYQSYEDLKINFQNQKFDTAIGWSLGAQILVRLIADKSLSVKRLILLAPPFQYVADEQYNSGYNKLAFKTFVYSFEHFSDICIKSFTALMKLHDDQTIDIIKSIDKDPNHYHYWLNWLNILGKFSCHSLDFNHFPKTIIVHGMNDAVTSYKQSEYFIDKINNSSLHLFENCGHMPHIHDITAITKIIEENQY